MPTFPVVILLLPLLVFLHGSQRMMDTTCSLQQRGMRISSIRRSPLSVSIARNRIETKAECTHQARHHHQCQRTCLPSLREQWPMKFSSSLDRLLRQPCRENPNDRSLRVRTNAFAEDNCVLCLSAFRWAAVESAAEFVFVAMLDASWPCVQHLLYLLHRLPTRSRLVIPRAISSSPSLDRHLLSCIVKNCWVRFRRLTFTCGDQGVTARKPWDTPNELPTIGVTNSVMKPGSLNNEGHLQLQNGNTGVLVLQ